MLEIKGFLENSLIEWDGKIASVLFLPGCNFRCPWCHVPDLAFYPDNLGLIPFEQVQETVHRQKKWLDGIVISGGEPTVHLSLPQFIEQIKGWELPVKLETNGSHPEMLRELIEGHLVDFVAMDIKNIVERGKGKGESTQYERTVGTQVDLEKIQESIDILLRSNIDYEFRTTVVPAFLHEANIEKIASSIHGAKRYILQQFVPGNASGEEMTKLNPYSQDKLQKMVGRAKMYVNNCQLRGI